MQPTGFRSIRWQLPLTYAAIALVAAVALSSILLGLLRPYFAQQEAELLDTSARMLTRSLGVRLDAPLSRETLPAVLRWLRFVPDFRVELLDPAGTPVFDSGLMDTFVVSVAPPIGPEQLPSAGERVVAAGGGATEVSGVAPVISLPDGNVMSFREPVTVTRGMFGEDIVWEAGGGTAGLFFSAAPFEQQPLFRRERSDMSVTHMVTTFDNGEVIGFVRLSHPPAIGSNVIQSIQSGALIAGIGAVLFAGVLGWWVSLRLTRPLSALSDATARMTHGDLSVRVDVRRGDELGALAESFNAMAGKVEHTVAVLRRFAADAAHELHTPLTAMKTNLELTRERPDEGRLAEAIEQLARLEALADDLLDLSRLELTEAPREPVDVVVLVREVSEVYASRAEQAGVEFALRMSGTLPPVRANPTLLRRALSNLLDNAVKFTPSGGDVSLATCADSGALEFVIEDTGIGIPSDDLPVLFSRFHRGSNTSAYPGSGLGLAIVKAIADVHHGTVRAENTATGARFVFKLPATS